MTEIFFDIETLGLEPTTDKIVAVSIAYNNNDEFPAIVSSAFDNEVTLLELFWKMVSQVENPVLISFNGNRFDIPFIIKRSIMHGVKCCKFESKDVMQACNSYPKFSSEPIQRGSLRFWARQMGIEVLTQDGNMIPAMHYNGDMKGIENHCSEDLTILIKLWKRLEYCNLKWLT